MFLIICFHCRSCWHAVRKVKVRSRMGLKWCSASQRKLMMPCTCLCWMVSTHTHTRIVTNGPLRPYLWHSHCCNCQQYNWSRRVPDPSFWNSTSLHIALCFSFPVPVFYLQDSMETLTPRESWYFRSPSRSGIPRLWSERDVTDTSFSSRCLWFLAKKSKIQMGAASTCTRANSL